MSIIKSGIIAAASLAGMLGAAPANARTVTITPPSIHFVRGRRVWSGPLYRHRRVRFSPVYQYPAPVYSYQTPVYSYQTPAYAYQAPSYAYQDGFRSRVEMELSQIEGAVRQRVAAGQLDGSALTAMESARDDIRQDVVDVSAKGYVNDADREHIERDLQALRQRFGC